VPTSRKCNVEIERYHEPTVADVAVQHTRAYGTSSESRSPIHGPTNGLKESPAMKTATICRVCVAVCVVALLAGCSSVGLGISIPFLPGVGIGVGVGSAGRWPVRVGVGVSQSGQVTSGAGVGTSTNMGGARVGVGVDTSGVIHDPNDPTARKQEVAGNKDFQTVCFEPTGTDWTAQGWLAGEFWPGRAHAGQPQPRRLTRKPPRHRVNPSASWPLSEIFPRQAQPLPAARGTGPPSRRLLKICARRYCANFLWFATSAAAIVAAVFQCRFAQQRVRVVRSADSAHRIRRCRALAHCRARLA